ncbi:MAG: hypothetical protein PVF40_10390 [Ectothiorhodospiraceae bacterium]|jgi:hypothetical protein
MNVSDYRERQVRYREESTGGAVRRNRVCGYRLSPSHGWEYLLDNHLDAGEESRWHRVGHIAVLGEN